MNDTIVALNNQCHSSRLSPFLIWGIGEIGEPIAQQLYETIQTKASDYSLCQLFKTEETPFPALQTTLAKLSQKAQTLGRLTDLEVKIILAAWQAQEQPIIQLLQNVSDSLNKATPGNQSISLSILIPPTAANESEIEQTRHFFQQLEPALNSMPFLNIAFLYQMPLDLYKQPINQADSTAELLELLFRECFDNDFSAIIHNIGWSVIRNNQTINNHKAAYSTLGIQTLVYLPDELIQHLESRLQNDIFKLGFNNQNNLNESQLKKLQQQAEHFLDSCKTQFNAQYPALHRITTVSTEDIYSNKVSEPQPSWETENEVNQKINSVTVILHAQIEAIVQQTDTELRKTLDSVLAINPAYLAGAKAFLELLQNNPETVGNDQAQKLTGLSALENEYQHIPLLTSIELYFPNRIKTLLSERQLPYPPAINTPDPSEAERIATTQNAIDILEASDEESHITSYYQSQFIVSIWDIICQHLDNKNCDTENARQLLTDTIAAFNTENSNIAAHIEELKQQREELEQQISEQYSLCPWYTKPFFFFTRYHTKVVEYIEEISNLDQQHILLNNCYPGLVETLITLLNDVLWPHIIRVMLLHGLTKKHQQLVDELDSFVEQVKTPCIEQWENNEAISECSYQTKTGILNREKLDFLYHQTIGEVPWLKWARLALQHEQPTITTESDQHPNYQHCKNLKDHFHQQAELLIAKLSDFSGEQFKYTHEFDALDIIELGKTGANYEFFQQTYNKIEYHPELSLGLIPIVEQQQLMKRVRVFRCTNEIKNKLKTAYAHLINENDQFVISDDPNVLDLTTFRFGLPAFLLHVLKREHGEGIS